MPITLISNQEGNWHYERRQRALVDVELGLGSAREAAFGQFPPLINAVNYAKSLSFFSGHEVVTVERALDFLIQLTRMLHVNFIKPALGCDDVLGVTLDVRGLAAEAA